MKYTSFVIKITTLDFDQFNASMPNRSNNFFQIKTPNMIVYVSSVGSSVLPRRFWLSIRVRREEIPFSASTNGSRKSFFTAHLSSSLQSLKDSSESQTTAQTLATHFNTQSSCVVFFLLYLLTQNVPETEESPGDSQTSLCLPALIP